MNLRMTAITGWVLVAATSLFGQTTVGIHGTRFTINGNTTYTAASGFPSADQNIEGTLLNVRAVQAIFDDANLSEPGSNGTSYKNGEFGPVSFDYPNGVYSASRNLQEFLAELPTWRKCGVLAVTVNLQGGGPTDGNFSGVGRSQNDGGSDAKSNLESPAAPTNRGQPQNNSGFDAHGNLKTLYAQRLQRVIQEADSLGMVVIVGYFYQGSASRIDTAPKDAYVVEAIKQASNFLRGLPDRNVLIEIANEVAVGAAGYQGHPLLQGDGVVDAVRLAQEVVHREIPVSFSWIADPPARESRGFLALHEADFVMFHTNLLSPDAVQGRIHAFRKATGYKRALLINEDEVSTFNLQAATQEHVGWGYYDQGLNDYHDGFQSPPVDWTIATMTKWMFFDQVARLTGSPEPPEPIEKSPLLPSIRLIGFEEGATVGPRARIEVVVEDHDPRWPIRRVEFFVDGVPYSSSSTAPFYLGGQRGLDISDLAPGKHILWVLAYDQRGPAFTEICSRVELTFILSHEGESN